MSNTVKHFIILVSKIRLLQMEKNFDLFFLSAYSVHLVLLNTFHNIYYFRQIHTMAHWKQFLHKALTYYI